MSRQILQDIIGDFQAEKFTRFFRIKNDKFQHPNQPLHYEGANFSEGKKLEEIVFEDSHLIVCSFRANQALSERSGKKAQYELGKKILKDTQTDAGIFIFYDKFGNFRFSLIYANYLDRHRDWSTFRRFTYFVSPELTNKTFLQRIGDGDFSSLAKIKEAFSVEKVTKEFYEDIANWYFWAVEHCRFPKDAEAEENGRNVAVIRLITRMIFIWFMRERGLVPKELFQESHIREVLKDIDPASSTYYRSILQNLFFATLSTKKEERQFRDEKRFNKGWNKDFGNQYVFRFHNLFARPEKIKDYFADIPFLNGGLFECLDDGRNDVYIDGFTERKKEYQPQVPNFLFFSGEKKADLNAYYGTKGKNYKVRGLFNILSSFNFTIDENSPDDVDIALDPELLGRVFENLLASFNPETSTTARKATGSYYTPREIVDYMVAESLKEYFKTHLRDIKDIDKKLETLFSTGSDENPFNKSESKKLVELIESVRIVDPAVGSGAFPMGALNRMVFILNKIDPGNELWKQAQLKAAEAIPDPQVRRNTMRQIEEFFKDKNADYGRKLYLIQKCIYGVDIQQIAVEISKLRFFISLLVDEKIDEKKENWGIEPLPNLDFKIMQGNSLISEFLGIDFDNGQTKQEQVGMLFTDKEDNLIKEFEQKKSEFQNESDKDRKAKLKNEVEDLMIKIFEAKVRKQKADYFRQVEEIERKYSTLPNKKTREEMVAKEKQKLSQKTGFNLENIEKQLREFTSKNKTKPFFAWKLYFAEVFEKGGFDIVIANPPYIENKKIAKTEKEKYKPHFRSAYKLYDLSILFLELAITLVRSKGIITFITTNKFIAADYGYNLRKILLDETCINEIVDVSSARVFQEAAAFPVIIRLVKNKSCDNNEVVIYPGIANVESFSRELSIKKQTVHQGDFSKNSTLVFNISGYLPLCLKIINSGTKELALLNHRFIYRPFGFTGWDKHLKNLTSAPASKKALRLIGAPSIFKYFVDHKRPIRIAGKQIREQYVSFCEEYKNVFEKLEQPNILIKEISPDLRAAYSDGSYCHFTGVYSLLIPNEFDRKLLLGLLNSNLFDFYYKSFYGSIHLSGDWLNINSSYLESLPIKNNASKYNKEIVDIVSKILTITKDDDYLENPAKQAKVREYEKQIDQLVYKLYSLTPEEIKIVESSTRP